MNIRRVVTANDSKGKSFVKWDKEIKGSVKRPGFTAYDMWITKHLPPEMIEEDPNTWEIGTSVAGGSVFRIGRYEPGVVARWHKTDSIDYSIVVSGEMWMQLDKEEVHLKAGDVVIQRGTNHNWVNRGTEVCIMLWVIMATDGGKSTGW
jgi:quercetin dioxygenase-like cupin family protein